MRRSQAALLSIVGESLTAPFVSGQIIGGMGQRSQLLPSLCARIKSQSLMMLNQYFTENDDDDDDDDDDDLECCDSKSFS